MAVKVIYCNQERIRESLAILQPITPTDDEHKSEWYNEEFGKQIIFAQNAHIKTLKQLLKDCNSHDDVGKVFEVVGFFPKWPPYIPNQDVSNEELIETNHKFWTEEIGKMIRAEYQIMLQKFIDKINSFK